MRGEYSTGEIEKSPGNEGKRNNVFYTPSWWEGNTILKFV